MSTRNLEEIVQERAGRVWPLFLDRDGVVNVRVMDGYVSDWSEFEFAPGALEALATIAGWAPRIVLVTNQQGIGKGVMSETALAEVHSRMTAEIAHAGGRIDTIRYCPHLATAGCRCRKPLPGMATDYLAAHPEVDGALSMMIGDTSSDVTMGLALAARTGGARVIRIDAVDDRRADATFSTLASFAEVLKKVIGGNSGPGQSAA